MAVSVGSMVMSIDVSMECDAALLAQTQLF